MLLYIYGKNVGALQEVDGVGLVGDVRLEGEVPDRTNTMV